ncbi:hypothetical protein [Flavobacterium sp.]|uniref:hypothetical protein n=1 Tax=Flavobacterium sp. TaxID=239 RepID=UPI003D11BCFD
MATNRTNIGSKFQNTDIPSENDFKEIFDSFVHKDEDKADFQMVEGGTDNDHYVTPALLYTGLKNIGIVTGNCYMPHKENFENSFNGTTLSLQKLPIRYSVKVYKNGQLLQEGQEGQEVQEYDYIVNYDTAVITFSGTVSDRNLEVNYWYKNLGPNPGGQSGEAIDFTSFLHTSGNESKTGLLTFNNTTTTSTNGIILKNSGAGSAATSLDVTNSGPGNGISLQNSSTGTGVKVSNTGAGAAINVNSATGSTGDILQVAKNNVVQTKIDSEGNITATKFVTAGGLRSQFIKGDGFPDPTAYAEDTKVIHTSGNEDRDGALKLTHNSSPAEDVLTITKNNSANCLKLVQNSNSNATTSTFDTSTADNNRRAISVQKIGIEKAFITHDGNVSGTSFTTLNEKADITDGFLTLADSVSPTATEGHAKLYAKTNGTTDMYVMGSDGVEKKIGAGGGTTITGTVNKLVKFNSTGNNVTDSNITDNDSLVTISKPTTIDSGTSDNSGLILSKLTSSASTGVSTFATGVGTSGKATCLTYKAGYYYSANQDGNVYKTSKATGVTTIFSTIGGALVHLCPADDGNLYVTRIGGNIYKVDSSGIAVLFKTGLAGNLYGIVQGVDGNLYVVELHGTIYRLTLSGDLTILSTVANAYGICNGIDGNLYIMNANSPGGILYKVTLAGVVTTFATNISGSLGTVFPIEKLSDGSFISNTNNNIFKISNTGVVTTIAATGLMYSNTIVVESDDTFYSISSTGIIQKTSLQSSKVLKTNSTGLVIKSTYLEDVPYLKASDVDLSSYIKTFSPTLTGKPTAPTATLGDNSTQIATTAFVLANTSASNSSSGSFTGVLTGYQNNVSGVTITTANYTKIGNIVTLQYAVNLNIVASNTNSFFEVEAPFFRAGVTMSYYIGQGTVYSTGLPQGIPGQAYFLSNNQGYIRFLFTSETGFGPRNVTFSCQYDITK